MANEVQNRQPTDLDEAELEQANGGAILIGLLLPAIQKVREDEVQTPSGLKAK